MAFNMMALMNEVSREGARPQYETAMLPLEKLVDNPLNGYRMEGIDELADAILLAGRVLQNVVVKAPDAQGGYMLISGHRRVAACRRLVAQGHTEFARVPALVEFEADESLRELMLIYTNSTSRVLSEAEKMQQAARLTVLLRGLKEAGRLSGRVRETAARMLNVASGQLGRYQAIASQMQDEGLKEAFAAGRIGVSVAYEASRLSPEGQAKAAGVLDTVGTLSLRDVAALKVTERGAALERRLDKGLEIQERRLKRLYLSHPCSGNVMENRRAAARIQRRLQGMLRRKAVIVNPLAMFEPLSDLPYDDVMACCLEALSVCDGIVMAGQFARSHGCMVEYEAALARALPVSYYVPGTGELSAEPPEA